MCSDYFLVKLPTNDDKYFQYINKFLNSLAKQDAKNDLYVLAIDTEGKEYKKKIGTVEEMMKEFVSIEQVSS